MTNGEAILTVLRDRGPLSREDLCGAVNSAYGIPPVITFTVVMSLKIQGEVTVEDGVYSAVALRAEAKASAPESWKPSDPVWPGPDVTDRDDVGGK